MQTLTFKTTIILLLLTGPFLNGRCQQCVSYYKSLGDSFMFHQFDSNIFKKVVCLSYMAKSDTNDNKRYTGDWPSAKNDTMYTLEWIGFFYEYYSTILNYTFHWYLTINKTGYVGPEWMLVKTIPSCIRLNRNCNLISRDEAVKAAIADSLPNHDNCYVELVSPKKSDNFYWAITGVDKRLVDYSVKPGDGLDLPIPPWKKTTTRLINAGSGTVTSLSEYYLVDK